MRLVDLDYVFDVPVLVSGDDELSRLRAIVNRLKATPAFTLKGRCDGCIYNHRKSPQKCSCCVRNVDMKDCYEVENNGE